MLVWQKIHCLSFVFPSNQSFSHMYVQTSISKRLYSLVDILSLNHHTHMSMGRGLGGRFYPFVFEYLRLLQIRSPRNQSTFYHSPWVVQNWTKKKELKCHITRDVWPDFNYLYKVSNKMGHKICVGQNVTHAGWMNNLSIFWGDHMSGFGWTNTFISCVMRFYRGRCIHGSQNTVQWIRYAGQSVTRTRRSRTNHHSTLLQCIPPTENELASQLTPPCSYSPDSSRLLLLPNLFPQYSLLWVQFATAAVLLYILDLTVLFISVLKRTMYEYISLMLYFNLHTTDVFFYINDNEHEVTRLLVNANKNKSFLGGLLLAQTRMFDQSSPKPVLACPMWPAPFPTPPGYRRPLTIHSLHWLLHPTWTLLSRRRQSSQHIMVSRTLQLLLCDSVIVRDIIESCRHGQRINTSSCTPI